MIVMIKIMIEKMDVNIRIQNIFNIYLWCDRDKEKGDREQERERVRF